VPFRQGEAAHGSTRQLTGGLPSGQVLLPTALLLFPAALLAGRLALATWPRGTPELGCAGLLKTVTIPDMLGSAVGLLTTPLLVTVKMPELLLGTSGVSLGLSSLPVMCTVSSGMHKTSQKSASPHASRSQCFPGSHALALHGSRADPAQSSSCWLQQVR
jgi:hypothetical protein